MRKSLVMLVSIIFLALACPSADAAISWDSAYSVFHYGVQNSGQFYYYDQVTRDYTPNFSTEAVEEATYGATASASLVGFSNVPGDILLNGTAKGPNGGVSPPLGLQVQAFAEIVPSSLTHLCHMVSMLGRMSCPMLRDGFE